MSSQRREEYMKTFHNLSPAEKRSDLTTAVACLLEIVAKQKAARAQDAGIIDGECTVGGEA